MEALRTAAVIPAYQAGATVGDVVRRTRAILDEVVVVDDGSTDDTRAAAREAGARVLFHDENRGKGRALKTAFEALETYDAVVTLDADGQHVPEEIPRLLAAAAEGADLVLGVRDHLFEEMSRVRRISNRISSRLISLAAGASLPDIQTGFRLYRTALYRAVGLHESGFDAESAVVVRAARRGFRVVAVSIRLGVVDGRGTSHYRALQDSFKIARAVIRARFDTAP